MAFGLLVALVLLALSDMAMSIDQSNLELICNTTMADELCDHLIEWDPDPVAETNFQYRTPPIVPAGTTCDWPAIRFGLIVEPSDRHTLVIDSITGTVSGKFRGEGTRDLTILVSNTSDFAIINFTIPIAVPPKLTLQGDTIFAAVGHPIKMDGFSYQFVNDEVARVELDEGITLPPNITLSPSNGVLTGTPISVVQLQMFLFAYGTSGARLLLPATTLLVNPEPQVIGWTPRGQLPSAVIWEPYRVPIPKGAQFRFFNVVADPDDDESLRFSTEDSNISNEGLPRGLKLNPESGAIEGIPSETGDFRFQIFAIEEASGAFFFLEEVSLTVDPMALASSSSALTGGALSGLILSILFCLLVVGLLITLFVRRKRRRDYIYKKAGVYQLRKWELPRGKVRIVRELGKGQFGTVHLAMLSVGKNKSNQAIAVKQCTAKNGVNTDLAVQFLSEADLLREFASPPHPNIVQLLGVSTDRRPFFIAMEYCSLGDLHTLLQRRRPRLSRINSAGVREAAVPAGLTLEQLLRLAAGIANGMAALGNHNPPIVHRDLAARNCLVSSDGGKLIAKISDFGLSRNTTEGYYVAGTEALLPVRWMAPESIRDGRFTVQSDVFALGVTLFELVTFGSMPYPGLSNAQVVNHVVSGKHMGKPASCPAEVYELMEETWLAEAKERPSFDQCQTRLQEFIFVDVEWPAGADSVLAANSLPLSPSERRLTVRPGVGAKGTLIDVTSSSNGQNLSFPGWTDRHGYMTATPRHVKGSPIAAAPPASGGDATYVSVNPAGAGTMFGTLPPQTLAAEGSPEAGSSSEVPGPARTTINGVTYVARQPSTERTTTPMYTPARLSQDGPLPQAHVVQSLSELADETKDPIGQARLIATCV
eukprot:m.479825 g.479825  ORF g.479825 m.479825 type:complete len:877 (-) comp21612_c0_seq1:272-2902(-)